MIESTFIEFVLGKSLAWYDLIGRLTKSREKQTFQFSILTALGGGAATSGVDELQPMIRNVVSMYC